jgi:starch synthase
VSRSYRADLLAGSPLKSLLRLSPHPFAHPNGIPVDARAARLAKLATPSHAAAKAALQEKYFGLGAPDAHTPLFAFVGRITAQKGVHLILESVEVLLRDYGMKLHFLVGGQAADTDPYGKRCIDMIRYLRDRYRACCWADPTFFFTDGALVNLGADFCLMPSAFEPKNVTRYHIVSPSSHACVLLFLRRGVCATEKLAIARSPTNLISGSLPMLPFVVMLFICLLL